MTKHFLLCAIAACFIFSNANVYGQNNDEVRTVALKNGTIRISLPLDWKWEGKAAFNGINTLFTRDNPKGYLAINIPVNLASFNNNNSLLVKYFNDFKKSLDDTGVLYDEVTSFLDVPVIISKLWSLDKAKKIRDIDFLKNGKYYRIIFSCDKGDFEELWNVIEPRIRSMEFVN